MPWGIFLPLCLSLGPPKRAERGKGMESTINIPPGRRVKPGPFYAKIVAFSCGGARGGDLGREGITLFEVPLVYRGGNHSLAPLLWFLLAFLAETKPGEGIKPNSGKIILRYKVFSQSLPLTHKISPIIETIGRSYSAYSFYSFSSFRLFFSFLSPSVLRRPKGDKDKSPETLSFPPAPVCGF